MIARVVFNRKIFFMILICYELPNGHPRCLWDMNEERRRARANLEFLADASREELHVGSVPRTSTAHGLVPAVVARVRIQRLVFALELIYIGRIHRSTMFKSISFDA
jgi:hypothetical protein